MYQAVSFNMRGNKVSQAAKCIVVMVKLSKKDKKQLEKFVKAGVLIKGKGGCFLDCFVDCADSSIHFCDFIDRWTMNPASVFKEIFPHPGPLPSDGRGRIIASLLAKRVPLKRSKDAQVLFPLPEGAG